jgi:5-methylthioadenosine/S-adenosylhomocysteine deaminase
MTGLVLVRTSDPNMAPAGDPCEAIVSFAMPANVDIVIVDGRTLRRGAKFTAFDHATIVAQAREAAFAIRDKAKWRT